MSKVITLLLTFLILFTTLISAQEAQQRTLILIQNILTEFAGVIFIFIFILILLIVAGVIKFPRAGLSPTLILFLALVFLLFVIPFFIEYPQTIEVPPAFTSGGELPPLATQLLTKLGIPKEWCFVPAIIYLFILPFAAIYTLVWAFLTSIKIFEGMRNVNRILALVATFLTLPMGIFMKIVWLVFSFIGVWSVLIFAATFILGIFFRGASVVAKEHAEYKKYAYSVRKRIEQMIDRLENIKKLPEGDVRKPELTSFLTNYEADLRTFNLWQKAWNARDSPTNENIDALLKELRDLAGR
ncbi:MAG: hypothetical protein QW472_00940 [Candidatus Aenigmatarchaeota archaeon]